MNLPIGGVKDAIHEIGGVNNPGNTNLPIGGVKDAIHEIGGVNNPGNTNLPIGVVAKRNFTCTMDHPASY